VAPSQSILADYLLGFEKGKKLNVSQISIYSSQLNLNFELFLSGYLPEEKLYSAVCRLNEKYAQILLESKSLLQILNLHHVYKSKLLQGCASCQSTKISDEFRD
jgi:hypothetical protein